MTTGSVIDVDGVRLHTESFGDPAHPPVLLVMGLGASMLWWDEEFCRMLAEAELFVIRYDHRDTGRSTHYLPGRPDYDAATLVHDAFAVLDGYEIHAAHVVGVSAGAAIAQLLALDSGSRVLSLTLISGTSAVPLDRNLPAPTERFRRFVAGAAVDWSEPTSVVEYLVGYARMLAGDQRPFDDAGCRDLIARDLDRADNPASLQNHDLIAHGADAPTSLSNISAPTLVIHGTADPMFPLEHGRALADAIAGATLLEMKGAGHGVDPRDRAAIASAIVGHIRPAVEPAPEPDVRFGDPASAPTPWSEVRQVLETAELFWISTVRRDGRPHVTPLPAVWHENRLHFCTGPDEQKAVNLASESRVALTTGTNMWRQGLDVVVEGNAARVIDDATLTALAERWRTKYNGAWDFTVDDGMFHHESGGPAVVFEVAPTKVLAFAKGQFAQTRYRFPKRGDRSPIPAQDDEGPRSP